MLKTTADDIVNMRLVAQQLVASDAGEPADVVRNLLAMQAQDFAASQWAIGVRLPGATIDDVVEAMNRGSIVRSWPMRGTLHFVAAEDLQWMLSLTAERTLRGATTRRRGLGLTESVLEKSAAIATELLRGGKSVTRAEFVRTMGDGGVDASGERGYHIIWFLAHTGLVCWGPMERTQQKLVLSSEWLPHVGERSRDEALTEFLRRYCAGHGPATLKDFAWWNKLTVADAKRALEGARDGLIELLLGDTSYWITAETHAYVQPHLTKAKKSVLALPAFDEHLLGYQDRSLMLEPEHARRVNAGGNGMFYPTIVTAGHVAGTWKKSATKGRLEIHRSPFRSLDAAQEKGFDRAVGLYAKFLGA